MYLLALASATLRPGGSDTHVIQEKVSGRVEEYEMQVSICSRYHIGKSILRISKRALNRRPVRESHHQKKPQNDCLTEVSSFSSQKAHVIPLASHGRENLINKAVASGRTGL